MGIRFRPLPRGFARGTADLSTSRNPGSPYTAGRAVAGVCALAIPLLFAPLLASAETYRLPLLPSASDALREGMVRIVNHSDEPGVVAVTAIDDSGFAFGPVTLELDAGETLQFSSTDLERGNGALGIATGIGGGQGDWRLVLDTPLDIEPLAYARTEAGFVDSLHDVVPRRSFYHRVTLLAPGNGLPDGSALRLINPTDAAAQVAVFGVDDANALAPGQVSTVLAPGAARTMTARELENGTTGLTGRLGDGAGDWQLLVFTDVAIEAMTLLDTASGPLANLSAARTEEGSVLLFLPAGEAMHEGRLRITNRSESGDIRILAADDSGQSFGPVSLRIGASRTVTLSSNDLETGNAAKRLRTGLGSGEGDWRLVLLSDLDLDVFAYARSQDGLVSIAHNVAAEGRRLHHVPFFNPAGETGQPSRLRLVNPTTGNAQIEIRAWDDAGAEAPDGAVNLTVGAGASTSLGAESLRDGARGLSGRLGEGEGGWRLAVRSDRDIQVMSLVENAAGHLTNLSTSSIRPGFLDPCVGGPADADGDGVSDHCDLEPDTARTLDRCSDGSYVSNPDGNTGLVVDCRVLVGFANYQAQGNALPAGHALRQWGTGAQSRIESWAGIEVAGRRVRAIRLPGNGVGDGDGGGSGSGVLTGSIPPDFSRMLGLTVLDLSGNALSGSIPWELGTLFNLQTLDLSGNRLNGFIPPELANPGFLRRLSLQSNELTGTVPLALWERSMLRDLRMRFDGNALLGFERPPEDGPAPVWAGGAADNGNASHHSVAWFQGPLVWEWDWQGEPVEHLRPVLGRWAALAVRVDHEVPEPPPVVTRVLDGEGNVLADGLDQAAPPATRSAGSGRWRTEYVFGLPGSLYRAGNRVVHVIDPEDELAETDEDDNEGEPIVLSGEAFSPFRATFIPFHAPNGEPPSVDVESLMFTTRAFLPIADDYRVEIAPARESNAFGLSQLLDEVRAIWNAEADPDEYYHGVFVWPWRGDESGRRRTAGVAELSGNVAVSTISDPDVIAHEFGHNLSLRHTPGCGAANSDPGYPYRNGELGPGAGWDVNWRRFVASEHDDYTDLMSYCGLFAFMSGYQYRRALNYRRALHPAAGAAGEPTLGPLGAVAQGAAEGVGQASAGSAGQASAGSAGQAPAGSDDTGGLALSGRIDAAGQWSITHAQGTDRGPRAPAPGGQFTLILLDGGGAELYREPLSVSLLSHSDEAGWAARTPVPADPAREVVILDADGLEVLRQELQID